MTRGTAKEIEEDKLEGGLLRNAASGVEAAPEDKAADMIVSDARLGSRDAAVVPGGKETAKKEGNLSGRSMLLKKR